jgi:hypothetical protein
MSEGYKVHIPGQKAAPAKPAGEPAPSTPAQRAKAEAEERRRKAEREAARARELGGPEGPEPTRYGDWEKKGICYDF